MATTRTSKAKQPEESEGDDQLVAESAKDLAIDFLLKRAFPYGQFAHAKEFIAEQEMADEVRAELLAAIDRNSL